MSVAPLLPDQDPAVVLIKEVSRINDIAQAQFKKSVYRDIVGQFIFGTLVCIVSVPFFLKRILVNFSP